MLFFEKKVNIIFKKKRTVEMDGALSSSRYNRDNQGSGSGNSGGGGGNSSGYRRGGRGGGRNRHFNNNRRGPYHRHDNNRNHRRHPHRNHQHNRGHHHGGGNNRVGNRFTNNYQSNNRTSSVDPKNAMWVQLSAMVAQMSISSNNKEEVVQNMMDLIKVLTAEKNAPLFLNTKLYQLIVHCASALPLHTPNYAALTFGLQQYSPLAVEPETNNPETDDPTTTNTDTSTDEDKNILKSCIQHASQLFGQDLDILQQKTAAPTPTSIADAFMRAKLILRFFTLLSHIGIVQLHPNSDDDNENERKGYSLSQFLVWLIERNDLPCTSLVYSTIPYLMSSTKDENIKEWIQTNLINNPNNTVHDNYKSIFEPGYGLHSLLLQEEQLDPSGEEEEEEESDDEDDEEAPACADTFMDLYRTVTQMVQSDDKDKNSFALLTDAPWSQLWAKKEETIVPNDSNGGTSMQDDTEDNSNDDTMKNDSENERTVPLVYTDKPLRLFMEGTESLLFSHNGTDETEIQTATLTTTIKSIIFGRLSLFGLPNDDEDDEEDMEEAEKNPQLNAFKQSFNMTDRFFLGESIRDVLLCHRSRISDTGVDKGTTKDVAEQIWSLSRSFGKSDSELGLEYGIVETMLSLLLQQSSSLSHVYLSKVLLDLTKLQPSTIPQALAVAVSSLTMDYLPNLVPDARDNLSSWFAFHLTNTDYQWPPSFWNYLATSSGCQAHFVRHTLFSMTSFVSLSSSIVTDCLPPQNDSSETLIQKLYKKPVEDTVTESHVQQQLQNRIWKQLEEVDSIREYMVGDKVSAEQDETEVVQGEDEMNYDGENGLGQIWWRTGLVIRALLLPAKRDWHHQQKSLESLNTNESNDNERMMEEDDNDDDLGWKENEDILSEIRDALERHRPVLLATLAKDTQAHEENLQLKGKQQEEESVLLILGEISILQQLSKCTSYSPHVVFINCLETLIQTQIVSPMAVLKWLLQYETSNRMDSDFAKGWWTYASLSLRVGMNRIATEATNNQSSNGMDDGIGMVIDTVGTILDDNNNDGSKILSMDEDLTPSFQKLKKLVSYACPLLQYASQRVCTMLVNLSNTNGGKRNKKRQLPLEVDLVEGLKCLIRSVLFELNVAVTECPESTESTSNGSSDEDKAYMQQQISMTAWLSKSPISGKELAKHCRSSCTNFEGTHADLIIQSLERF